jgi:hypothetical protein
MLESPPPHAQIVKSVLSVLRQSAALVSGFVGQAMPELSA